MAVLPLLNFLHHSRIKKGVQMEKSVSSHLFVQETDLWGQFLENWVELLRPAPKLFWLLFLVKKLSARKWQIFLDIFGSAKNPN